MRAPDAVAFLIEAAARLLEQRGGRSGSPLWLAATAMKTLAFESS